MYTKLITIVVPLRGRIETTKLLFESLEKNTVNKDNIELICLTDFDDKETNKVIDSFKGTFEVKKITQKQKNPFNLSKYYQDGLKLASSSRFMWALGNDCEISSYGWDKELEKISFKKETFFYIRINDGVHSEEDYINNIETGCCFPILSYNYFLTTGEFYPVETPTWGADHVLWNSLRLLNKNVEVINLYKIAINHYSPHSNDIKFKRNRDDSYFRMQRNSITLDPLVKMNAIKNCIEKNGIC